MLIRSVGNCSSLLGSLSDDVFKRRTSTGSGLFSFLNGGFAQLFSQIASIRVNKLMNTNCISSRHVNRENASLPVDVRRSKTPLLKLFNETSPTYFSGASRSSEIPEIRGGSLQNIFFGPLGLSLV